MRLLREHLRSVRPQPSLRFGFLPRHRSGQGRSYGRGHLSTYRARPSQALSSPAWQEGAIYTATTLLNQGVQVTVYDEDIAANDLIGGPVTVRPTETDLRTGTLTVKNIGQVQSINFSLIAQ